MFLFLSIETVLIQTCKAGVQLFHWSVLVILLFQVWATFLFDLGYFWQQYAKLLQQIHVKKLAILPR